MPYGGLNDKLEVCDYDCVANSRQMFNETTGQWSTTCCCVGSLCNSPEGRSINISVAENEGQSSQSTFLQYVGPNPITLHNMVIFCHYSCLVCLTLGYSSSL